MADTSVAYLRFLSGLHLDNLLPSGISLINPYPNPEVRRVLKLFCDKYYGDSNKRVLILGINPGRFGAGVTGIPFTDPVALDRFCGIQNSFPQRRELSSTFVYELINAYGGETLFYNSFMIGSVCPLGFLSGTTNFNFYDTPQLLLNTRNFIIASLKKQAEIAGRNDAVIVLGKKNSEVLQRLNSELKLFTEVITLDHPRYIMQYRRKELQKYIAEFIRILLSY